MNWTEEQMSAYMAEYMVFMKATERIGPCGPGDRPDEGRESKLQTKIMNWANDKGYPVFHDRSRKKNVPGWPDITLCLPKGIVLFCELKSEKGIMLKEQREIRQQMVFLGHHHFIVKSYRQFQELIRSM